MKAQIETNVSINLKREDYNKLQNMIDELSELYRQLEEIEDVGDLTDLLDNITYSIYEFCEDSRVGILD